MIAVALALLSAFGFAANAVTARVGMQGIPPLPSVFVSGAASAVPTLILVLLFDRPELMALPLVAFPLFLGHGILTSVGGRIEAYLSINLIGAGRSAPFIGTSALFAAIFAIVFLGEELHPLVGLGTVSIVSGLVVSGGETLFRQNWQIDRRSLLGYLTGLGAAASFGGSNLVAKTLTQEFGSPLVVAFFAMFFGTLILAPVSTRQTVEGLKNFSGNLGYVAVSGLATSVGVISLYFALERAPAVEVVPIASVNPLMTLLMVHLFLNRLERVTAWVLVGTVAAVAGVVLVVAGSSL